MYRAVYSCLKERCICSEEIDQFSCWAMPVKISIGPSLESCSQVSIKVLLAINLFIGTLPTIRIKPGIDNIENGETFF